MENDNSFNLKKILFYERNPHTATREVFLCMLAYHTRIGSKKLAAVATQCRICLCRRDQTKQPSKKHLLRNQARRGSWRCTHRRRSGPPAPLCPCSSPSPRSAATGQSTGDTSTDPTAPMPAPAWVLPGRATVQPLSSHAGACKNSGAVNARKLRHQYCTLPESNLWRI